MSSALGGLCQRYALLFGRLTGNFQLPYWGGTDFSIPGPSGLLAHASQYGAGRKAASAAALGAAQLPYWAKLRPVGAQEPPVLSCALGLE